MSEALVGLRGALDSLLGPENAGRFTEDELRLLLEGGYATLEDLQVASYTGLRAANLKPASADHIIHAQARRREAAAAGLGVGSTAGGGAPARPGSGSTAAGGAAAGPGSGSTAAGGGCRHGSSGAAGAGATAPAQPQLPPAPAAGAVLELMELLGDGSTSFVATLVLISPDGLAATARHAVVWEDGYIHPRRLWVADGVELRHVATFRKLDVSLLRLTRRPDRGSGSSGGDSASSSGGAAAVPAGEPWPYVEIAPRSYLKPDAHLTVYSYPAVAQRLGLTASGPVITHGRLAHCSEEQLLCAADYMGFPGSSGGAVMCDGKLIGIHVEAVSHDDRDDTKQPDVDNDDEEPMNVRGKALEKFDEPVERPAAAAAGGPAAMAGSTAARQAKGAAAAAVGALAARVGALEVNEQHKGALSLFTPWHLVATGLKLVGIPPPQSGLTRVMSAQEMAVALARGGEAEGARKRVRGR